MYIGHCLTAQSTTNRQCTNNFQPSGLDQTAAQPKDLHLGEDNGWKPSYPTTPLVLRY